MILDPTLWPESPFGQSSLSSAGDSYAIQEDTWSPFEESFTNAQILAQSTGSLDTQEDAYLNSPTNAYQTAFEINWSPEDLMSPFPWVNFSSAGKGEQTNEECKQENIKTESAANSPIASPSPTALTDSSSKMIRRSSDPSRTMSTKTAKISKRMKKDCDSPKASRTSKRTKHTLETLRPGLTNKKQRSASSASISSVVSQDSRNSHNLIEKQYRNRLNLQFESLLETLPKELAGEAGEKRVSKAEVLVHANEYIQELEEEMRLLEEKNDGLEECVESWKVKWSKFGGGNVPE
jgi:hypothetical protein